MNTPSDGGPAFPIILDTMEDLGSKRVWYKPGMSLRAYFIAHAPAEPWGWFHPIVEAEPVEPPLEDDRVWKFNPEERSLAKNWRKDPCYDPPQRFLRQFVEMWKDYWQRRDEWCKHRGRERQIQWPAFWADQMIQQLNIKT